MGAPQGDTIESLLCYMGFFQFSVGEVTVDGDGSTWNTMGLWVGFSGSGKLSITNGGTISGSIASISGIPEVPGEVLVDGTNSNWTLSDGLYVGDQAGAVLTISNGGHVSNNNGYIGIGANTVSEVTVSGIGSTWINGGELYVGNAGSGTLAIADGGLVSVASTLTIDDNADGTSFINMSGTGTLALFGDADDSLSSFLDLISGSDAILYWDESISDWANITSATLGTDYTLTYIDDAGNDLLGYTLLTVDTSPDPIPGDANNDWTVNETDTAILAANWQTLTGATWKMGDFNDDGKVNDIDATLMAANWEHSVAPPVSVPEPSNLFMLSTITLALAGYGFCRRRLFANLCLL